MAERGLNVVEAGVRMVLALGCLVAATETYAVADDLRGRIQSPPSAVQHWLGDQWDTGEYFLSPVVTTLETVRSGVSGQPRAELREATPLGTALLGTDALVGLALGSLLYRRKTH
ncbi:hypothetical protein IPL85_00610 [Candidatus Saccharibacteria bacterium]|nr:MAG: hypothetical protein IPL85_00610 [Candidatus Saccharibacteria bacterium]